MNLPDFRAARILVVGDVMLDRYWFGDVSRISPEAPVPVVCVARTEERPGGAANVARNAAALGASVSLLSVVGNDEAGERIATLAAAERVHAVLHRDSSVSTTIKLRVIARQQQLVRIDFENTPSREVLADKLNDFESLLAGCDVVVLSDYGKGGLTHIVRMIELACAHGKRVLVDPKGDDYSRYAGAHVITPNRAELREVVGRWIDEADLLRRIESLRVTLRLEAVLLTRSEEGMTMYQQDSVTHVPTQAREVFDVSGAGDTVISTLAVALACGEPLPEAMRIANHAAGIVVGKLGTAVVTRDELIADLANRT